MTRQQDFGILLGLAHQVFIADLAVHMARAGYEDLTRSEGYVCRTLADGPLTVTELAQSLGITVQGAGLIAQEMESRGYVERQKRDTDQRVRVLCLTAKGRDVVSKAHRFHQSFERKLAKLMGEGRVEATRTVLTGLIEQHDDDEEIVRRLRLG
jgi:DNA-binding MarR family transcriptional regulator